MAKANKDGWIRHRGGKCPIYDGALVDYRMRDGEIDDSGRVAAMLRWNHIGGCADIMAYRIHKPAEQPINMQAMAESADALGDSHADVMESVLSRMDGPLQWRDRIREIDRTVEALEEERVSLVQRLEGEGLQLLRKSPDMNNPDNWLEGDVLVSTLTTGNYTKGNLYRFIRHSAEYGSARTLDDKGMENGMLAQNFKFHSRPSA